MLDQQVCKGPGCTPSKAQGRDRDFFAVACVWYFRGAGAGAVDLKVDKDNTAAIALYHKLGMLFVG